MLFQVAVGPNYFFEIAKLRALRVLYASMAREYGFNENCIILATPSRRNKTLYDYNVNLLRTTTECMSAVLGGADSICNLPYDVLYHKNNEFGSRIARNQLLILKHESYFEKVANPQDRMKSEIELYPFLKKKFRKTLLSPILERRLAENLEQERLKKEDQ